MIALFAAHKAGFLTKKHWLPNIIAGLIVGVVALPLGMAFAIASGVKPEQGIYTAIIAGFLVSVFGGSRLQIAGPTGAFIVILSGITAQYGVVGLQIATMMAGVILLLLGLAKLGGVIKFIPAPVIVGFTAGIGVIIWIGQWGAFFGLPKVVGEHFHEKFWHTLQVLPELHWATSLLGILSLLLVLVTPKIPYLKKIPGPLVAMVVATSLQALFHFDGVATIGSAFGGIPQGLPEFAVPQFTASQLISLIGPAFTIAMLGAIESLLSAVVADGMAGTRHDSNQELVGQGIANIITPLFGGFAATGAIARTATNIRNGGNSPLAGIFHAITLLLIILFLAPLAASIPLAALAAILFVVAWNMSEVKHFIHMLTHAPRADVAILLITFVLTVFADLVVAVNIGVILATLHFLRRMSMSVEVLPQDERQIGVELIQQGLMKLPEGVLVYAIEGPFFFGAVENFERVLAETHSDPKVLVIRLLRVPFVDMTGLQALQEAIGELQQRGVKVLLCEANAAVMAKMERAGLLATLGRVNYCPDLASAVTRADALSSV
ncbi:MULTISPECIES: SulP family inorganic anion transporter [Deefgea]|uniref:STAS domain-containing protein n=1 Tax=Deefgea chitinilytica TaxID=570276 RepID=A0ABS2C9V0_9NEIS|nr:MULTISPECIES: SulP family inorganic anion transporter [Deefgea]MBM5570905.1 STAS domain-containing protein [Deefgea chitinilytica]MBM9888134.1 STAS domain-containing protein [Deefgea sp. CFH1-16]